MPIYFAWFTTALLSVGGDANDQNLPQSGRLLYCVISGFCNTYPTFRQKSTKGNFRVADNTLGMCRTRTAAMLVGRYAPESRTNDEAPNPSASRCPRVPSFESALTRKHQLISGSGATGRPEARADLHRHGCRGPKAWRNNFSPFRYPLTASQHGRHLTAR